MGPLGRRALVLARLWHVPAFLGACVVALTLSAVLPAVLVLPSITALDRATTPTVVFAALLVGVLAAGVAEEPMATAAAMAPRRVARWSLVRLVAALLVGALCLGGPWLSTGPAGVVALLTFAAEARITARLLGARLAWVLPVLHASAAVLLGYTSTGEPTAWAWFLSSDPQLADWTTTAALATAGAAMTTRSARHPRT